MNVSHTCTHADLCGTLCANGAARDLDEGLLERGVGDAPVLDLESVLDLAHTIEHLHSAQCKPALACMPMHAYTCESACTYAYVGRAVPRQYVRDACLSLCSVPASCGGVSTTTHCLYLGAVRWQE